MKFLRRYAPLMAVVMSLNLLFVSCAPTADGNATISAKYSGEEIFEGLFFFQHDIAANLPQLNQVATEINKVRAENLEVDKHIGGLATMTTDYININYPGFFDELQTVMYSGDYYQIQQKLDLSGQLIEQAILTSEEYAPIYAIGKEISKDAELLAEIQALDLTQEADQKQLQKLLSTIDGMADLDEKARGTCVAAVVAAVYLVVGAVNLAVAAYYVVAAAAVVVTLAFWTHSPEPSDELQGNDGPLLNEELFVVEVSKFFSGGK